MCVGGGGGWMEGYDLVERSSQEDFIGTWNT